MDAPQDKNMLSSSARSIIDAQFKVSTPQPVKSWVADALRTLWYKVTGKVV